MQDWTKRDSFQGFKPVARAASSMRKANSEAAKLGSFLRLASESHVRLPS